MTARPGRHRPQPARWPITAIGTTAAVLTVAAVAASIGSAFTVAAPERIATPPTATSRPAASWSLAWPTPAMPSVGGEGAWDPTTETPAVSTQRRNRPGIATSARVPSSQPAQVSVPPTAPEVTQPVESAAPNTETPEVTPVTVSVSPTTTVETPPSTSKTRRPNRGHHETTPL